MNTLYFLMAEFDTVAPQLAEVCEKYLGIKPATAEKKALLGELALPTFRIGESQKAPRLVHLSDLAEHIDKARKEARELYDHINS
ncbi:pyocin activator PrtN family protein [Klebsiella aerogenes]|uniref:pyocin activator PrtN family protein n=1 Tax=Klebsiella aerogenes TaxID=548 RepID=UPI003511EC61|nr:pyocin activator PrtN family protein [Klebsiella aerogenes]